MAPESDTVVDPTLADPTPAQTGDDAAAAAAEFADHVANTSVKDLAASAAGDAAKARHILEVEQARGDDARSSLVDALEKQLAASVPEASTEGPPVDETGRQIAQPDLIDNSELPDPAAAAEQVLADEEEAIAAASDSGRLLLSDEPQAAPSGRS